MWKKIFAGLLFLVSLLFGAFLIERKRRQNSESSLENAEYNKDKAVLSVKLENLTKEQQAALAIAEVEKGRKLSDKELEDYLNRM